MNRHSSSFWSRLRVVFFIDSLSAIVVFVLVEILENRLTGERTAVESAEGTTSVLTVLE